MSLCKVCATHVALEKPPASDTTDASYSLNSKLLRCQIEVKFAEGDAVSVVSDAGGVSGAPRSMDKEFVLPYFWPKCYQKLREVTYLTSWGPEIFVRRGENFDVPPRVAQFLEILEITCSEAFIASGYNQKLL